MAPPPPGPMILKSPGRWATLGVLVKQTHTAKTIAQRMRSFIVSCLTWRQRIGRAPIEAAEFYSSRELETGRPSFGHLTRRPALLQEQSLERDPQPQSDGAPTIHTFL